MPLLLLLSLAFGQTVSVNAEALWAAARAGDKAGVERALAAGVPADAPTRYQQTALMLAAERGRTEIVELLIAKGANVNQRDSFYGTRVLDVAIQGGHLGIARMLLEKGADGAAAALLAGVRAKDAALVRAALASPKLDVTRLPAAVTAAERAGDVTITAMVKDAAAKNSVPEKPAFPVDPTTMQSYVGPYRNEDGSLTAAVTLKDGKLTLQPTGSSEIALVPRAEGVFEAEQIQGFTVTFSGRAGTIERVLVVTPGGQFSLARVSAAAAAAGAAAPASPSAADLEALKKPAARASARPWPGFRGIDASGNGDGQGAPVEWDVTTGKNVLWKTPIPGISNASPIVHGDSIYVVTAISSANDRTFKSGNYGDVRSVDDLSEHTWKVYALDAKTGAIAWEREVFTGAPRTKRHTKSTQANATPATDGRRIISVFGAIGLLVAHDASGKELWRKDIGVVDSGWFFDPGVQWGHSSSPIIYENTVIVQADQQKASFVAAYDLTTGREVWKTTREAEIPTWGTPTIAKGPKGDEIVTNGTKVRGYDAKSGTLLWELGPNSEITIATPVVDGNLVFIAGGYPPVRPIYAVKIGSRGDLSLAKGATASDAIQWSNGDGTYTPSPIAYGGLLYLFNNNGILTAFRAETGERVFRARVGGGGAFSASPVAADGRLYFASEDGDVFVVKAGAPYVEITKNPVGEVILATPAISNGMIVIRTLGGVVAVGQK